MFRRVRRSVLWVACAFALTTVLGFDASPRYGLVGNVLAQAEGEGAAAEGAAAGAEGGGEATEGGEGVKKDTSVLGFFFKALGVEYTTVFALISFIFVALSVSTFLSTRRASICPPALIESFDQLLVEQRYQDAYELAKNDESVLGHVLSAGLAKLSVGYEHAIEAMKEVASIEGLKLEQRLSYISLIGALAPMVGLVGTVDGMIRSFYTIAVAGGSPEPSKLAEGIATALIATLIGLALAIPAMIVFAVIRNRLARLMLEVDITGDQLMSRFEQAGK